MDAYYVFIDCVHMETYRKKSVEIEGCYVVQVVREDKHHEVLGIFNKPTEGALAGVRCSQSRVNIVCAIAQESADRGSAAGFLHGRP